MGTVVIINGPNLNLLGIRQPTLYGSLTMQQILSDIEKKYPHVSFEYKQSNHEGDLIDWVQQFSLNTCKYSGMIINAGGYTHTSISLRDAITCSLIPVVEVHITNIKHREPFRQQSLLTDVCAHSIIGKGSTGYLLAVEWIINNCK